MAEADDDAALESVEITYVDPDSGNICRRDVYCDPADWEGPRRREARFLISSDLVNILNEAVRAKKHRFENRHEDLANIRFGYTCALHQLRISAERVIAQSQLDEDEDDSFDDSGEEADWEFGEVSSPSSPPRRVRASPDSPSLGAKARGRSRNSGKGSPTRASVQQAEQAQVSKVKYYQPELYLDSFTLEKLGDAIYGFKQVLQNEMKETADNIRELGATGWLDILQKMIKQGQDPVALADQLLALVEDPKKRRDIEDKISGGVRTQHDRLKPIVDKLEVDFADFSERHDLVAEQLRQSIAAIQTGEQRLLEIQRRMKDPPRYLPPDSESDPESEEEPIDDSAFLARIAELKRQLFAEWEERLSKAKDEAAAARKFMEEWQAKYDAYDKDALKRIEQELAALEEAIAALRKRIEKLNSKLRRLQEKEKQILDQVAEEEGYLQGIRDKLAGLPPPPPASTKFVKLSKELKRLLKEEERLKKTILIPINKVKAIRMELRRLYAKLGWEWDFSDSEDDDVKPYWMRRKLAQQGIVPFDPNDFVYQERGYQGKRLKNLARKEQAKRAAHLMSQMVACRHLHSETVADMLRKEMKAIAAGLEDAPPAPGPFATDDGDLRAVDPIERSLQSVQQRLSTSTWDRSLSPRPMKEWNEVQAACGRLLRLQQFGSSLLEQIRQCARGLSEALPAEAGSPLAGPRSQLVVLAAALGAQRVEPELLEETEEADQELDGICSTIQDVIAEAMRLTDKVGPISALLDHSSRLAELQKQMSDLRSQRRLALAELKDAAGPDALAVCSTRLPSIRATSLFDSTTSGGMSPASRGCFSPVSARSLMGSDMRRQGLGASSSRLLNPRLEAVCEPMMSPGGGAAGSCIRSLTAKRLEDTSREISVDLGFRPDGGGEEPLESWALFKVSKGMASDLDASGKGKNGGELGAGKNMDSKVARLVQKASSDFRDYVAQTKQSSKEMWQSASAPDLLNDKFKRGTSLPQLVQRGKEQGSPAAPGGSWKAKAGRGPGGAATLGEASPPARSTRRRGGGNSGGGGGASGPSSSGRHAAGLGSSPSSCR